MKITIFIFAFFLLCNCKNRVNNIVISIDEPVNGYAAQMIWTPYEVSSYDKNNVTGPAILELTSLANHKKISVKYEGFCLGYYLPSYHIDNLKIENGFVKSYSNSDITVSYSDLENKLEERTPFYFYDVNFDHIEELIIVSADVDPNLRETEFFDISHPNEAPENINETALLSLSSFNQEDGRKCFLNAKFDYKTKIISITSYFGDEHWDVSLFKLNQGMYDADTQFVQIGTENHDTSAKPGFDKVKYYMQGKKFQVKWIKLKN